MSLINYLDLSFNMRDIAIFLAGFFFGAFLYDQNSLKMKIEQLEFSVMLLKKMVIEPGSIDKQGKV